MLGTAIGVLTFFITEAFFFRFIHNLEAGFMPSVVLAIVAGIAFEVWLLELDENTYNPPAALYEIPMPQAIALVKRVIKTYYNGSRRWRLTYDDRMTGEIQASMTFFDDSYSDMRWLVPSGKVERIINLRAHVMTSDELGTRVQLNWAVESPLSRTDCNQIIHETTTLIHDELIEAQNKATAIGSY